MTRSNTTNNPDAELVALGEQFEILLEKIRRYDTLPRVSICNDSQCRTKYRGCPRPRSAVFAQKR